MRLTKSKAPVNTAIFIKSLCTAVHRGDVFEYLAFIIEVLPIVHEHFFWIPERENLKKKQDHQRWGYSTVTHVEQPVYLAIWKDLSKKKRKVQRKRIEP